MKDKTIINLNNVQLDNESEKTKIIGEKGTLLCDYGL